MLILLMLTKGFLRLIFKVNNNKNLDADEGVSNSGEMVGLSKSSINRNESTL